MAPAFTLFAIGCTVLTLAACQSEKEPEAMATDSTAAMADTPAMTDATPVDTTLVTRVDTGIVLADTVIKPGKTVVTSEKPTTPATAATTPPSTQTPATSQPARTEPPAPVETRPAEPAPSREVEVAKPAATPVPATPPATTASDPKAIFREQKCTPCHTVTSQGITGSAKSDLSNVGSKHSQAWIIGFLKKQEELDGKKHKKTWTGSEEDLKMLAQWLAGLK